MLKIAMKILVQYWGLIIVILLSFWAVQPLFISGFFPMHDDTQVARVDQMTKALRDGSFPVRWVRDLGYGFGYPVFNFYAPLAYYVGAFVNLFGEDTLTSTKVMIGIGVFLSGIFMYLFAKEIWGKMGGSISALLYLYSPYHAVDIYVRGAVGELWAYAFLPLMALGFYKGNIALGVIGLAGIILSHNLTAMIITPFLLIAIFLHGYLAYRQQKFYALRSGLYAFLLALGLSAFYWLPAIGELVYTNVQSQVGGGADFREHFVCWQQLWDSPWGFGGSAPGCVDGLSLKIGKLHLLLALVPLLAMVAFWKKDRMLIKIVLLFFFAFFAAIFMMLDIAKPVWEAIPPLSYLQYPWRFLLITSFTTAFLGGGVMWFLKNLRGKNYIAPLSAVALIIIILLYFNTRLFQPQAVLSKTAADYTEGTAIIWTASKISDEYMPQGFKKPTNENDVPRRRVVTGDILEDKTQRLVFLINNEEEKEVLVSIAPFLAWQVFIDNAQVSYQPTREGIKIVIPQGKHLVGLSFAQTGIEKLGNGISVISLFLMLYYIYKRTGRKTRFVF